MKLILILFLKLTLIFFTSIVSIWIIIFPTFEGRAKDLDLVNIYLDPFIIYIYIASTPFFYGILQIFKLLNLIKANKTTSYEGINTLKKIKYASVLQIIFILFGVLYIRLFANGDDPAGPMMIGLIIIFLLLMIIFAAGFYQRFLENKVHLKTKN